MYDELSKCLLLKRISFKIKKKENFDFLTNFNVSYPGKFEKYIKLRNKFIMYFHKLFCMIYVECSNG